MDGNQLSEDKRIALKVLEKSLLSGEHYVNFETAKKLKSKGYNLQNAEYRGWPCYATKNCKDDNGDKSDRIGILCFEGSIERDPFAKERIKRFKKIAAPTYEMVLNWLRYNKNVHIWAYPVLLDEFVPGNWCYTFSYIFGNEYNGNIGTYNSYEEAIEKAVEYILEKI